MGVRDADLLESMAFQGKLPKLAIVVDIQEVFSHCPKAFVRAMVEHPTGYHPLLARITNAGDGCCLQIKQDPRHPGCIGFGAAFPWPARSHAYASQNLFPRTAQGLLPARAGSPLAGRDLHPLDDVRSFMVASQPPIPFDPQGLVALFCLSVLGQFLFLFALMEDNADTALIKTALVVRKLGAESKRP